MTNIIRAIATNDDDNRIYGMTRVVTLFVLAFYHVMVFLAFCLDPKHKFDGVHYVEGACGIIVLYACARTIRDLLPMLLKIKLGIPDKDQ